MAPPARNLVNLENVTVAHGTRLLMDAVSLGVSRATGSASSAATAAARPPCSRR
jgi:hypothetical protein